MTAWPPPYTIKKHRRAKHVKFRIVAGKGLCITVPPRFSLKEIPKLLEECKEWILKQLHKLQTTISDAMPENILLHAIDESWSIRYLSTDKKLSLTTNLNGEIILVGAINDMTLVKKQLRAWVRHRAKEYLPEKLQEVSRAIQLPYQKVNVKSQKTLWGSCTSKKSISLNDKLLFLPESLVKHVMIHELCHTKHLNHSAKFWQLVASFDPNWEEHDRLLRQADKFIPAWLLHHA